MWLGFCCPPPLSCCPNLLPSLYHPSLQQLAASAQERSCHAQIPSPLPLETVCSRWQELCQLLALQEPLPAPVVGSWGMLAEQGMGCTAGASRADALPCPPPSLWAPPPADSQASLLHKLHHELEDRFSHTCLGLQKPIPVHLELPLVRKQQSVHDGWGGKSLLLNQGLPQSATIPAQCCAGSPWEGSRALLFLLCSRWLIDLSCCPWHTQPWGSALGQVGRLAVIAKGLLQPPGRVSFSPSWGPWGLLGSLWEGMSLCVPLCKQEFTHSAWPSTGCSVAIPALAGVQQAAALLGMGKECSSQEKMVFPKCSPTHRELVEIARQEIKGKSSVTN